MHHWRLHIQKTRVSKLILSRVGTAWFKTTWFKTALLLGSLWCLLIPDSSTADTQSRSSITVTAVLADNSPPFSSYSTEKQAYEGFAVNYFNWLASHQSTDYQINFVSFPLARGTREMSSRGYDLFVYAEHPDLLESDNVKVAEVLTFSSELWHVKDNGSCRFDRGYLRGRVGTIYWHKDLPLLSRAKVTILSSTTQFIRMLNQKRVDSILNIAGIFEPALIAAGLDPEDYCRHFLFDTKLYLWAGKDSAVVENIESWRNVIARFNKEHLGGNNNLTELSRWYYRNTPSK